MSGKGSGRGISPENVKPLRKPRETQAVQDGGPALNSVPTNVPVSSFKSLSLNANAPEFVPRFSLPTNIKVEEQAKQVDTVVVEYVKDTLDRLTYNPGEFDMCVEDLTLAWKARIHDVSTLNEVAKVIVEQSILQKNFTYTGARLCDLIARRKDLNDVLDTSKNFRTVFLTRCSEEHNQREELLKNPDTIPRVHGFAMFLAELFCKFRYENKDVPLEILRKKMLEMLMTLIKHGSNDSLLYAGRILKLTGSLLEDPSFTNNEVQAKLAEIFGEISRLIDGSSLPRSISVFLDSVINLRRLNWGQEPVAVPHPSTLSPTAPPFQSNSTSNPPMYPGEEVYYTQDEFFTDDVDDIIPVSNPDQWNDYCEDGSQSDDNNYYYQNDMNGEEGEDDAFTDEMRRDFDQFMSEQPPPPRG